MGLTRRCAALLGRSAAARRGLSTRCNAALEDTTRAALAQWALPSKCGGMGGHSASAVSTFLLQRRGFASGDLPPHSELGMPALSPTMSQVQMLALLGHCCLLWWGKLRWQSAY